MIPTVTLRHLRRWGTGRLCKVQEIQGLHDARPAPLGTPEPVALVGGLPLAILPRHLAPGRAAAQHRQDTIQHRAVVMARTPNRRALRWEQREDALPLGVGKWASHLGRCDTGLTGTPGIGPGTGA
jgi:hypothetical protein